MWSPGNNLQISMYKFKVGDRVKVESIPLRGVVKERMFVAHVWPGRTEYKVEFTGAQGKQQALWINESDLAADKLTNAELVVEMAAEYGRTEGVKCTKMWAHAYKLKFAGFSELEIHFGLHNPNKREIFVYPYVAVTGQGYKKVPDFGDKYFNGDDADAQAKKYIEDILASLRKPKVDVEAAATEVFDTLERLYRFKPHDNGNKRVTRYTSKLEQAKANAGAEAQELHITARYFSSGVVLFQLELSGQHRFFEHTSNTRFGFRVSKPGTDANAEYVLFDADPDQDRRRTGCTFDLACRKPLEGETQKEYVKYLWTRYETVTRLHNSARSAYYRYARAKDLETDKVAQYKEIMNHFGLTLVAGVKMSQPHPYYETRRDQSGGRPIYAQFTYKDGKIHTEFKSLNPNYAVMDSVRYPGTQKLMDSRMFASVGTIELSAHNTIRPMDVTDRPKCINEIHWVMELVGAMNELIARRERESWEPVSPVALSGKPFFTNNSMKDRAKELIDNPGSVVTRIDTGDLFTSGDVEYTIKVRKYL